MEKVICPHCDSDLIISFYDYDTGLTRYTCEECNSNFTNRDIPYNDYEE